MGRDQGLLDFIEHLITFMDLSNVDQHALGLGAAAIILPPTLGENVELGRRIWALGAMPKEDQYLVFWYREYPDGGFSWGPIFTGEVINREGILIRVPATREMIVLEDGYGGTKDLPLPSYSTDNTGRW